MNAEFRMQNAELAFPIGEGGPLAVDEVVLEIQNYLHLIRHGDAVPPSPTGKA